MLGGANMNAGHTSHAPNTGMVEIGKIRNNPYQPRKRFDDDEQKQLTESIKTHGILQPIVVRLFLRKYSIYCWVILLV